MKKSLLLKILAVITVVSTSLFIATACNEEHTHEHVETITQPTCTEGGYSTFTCECGNSYQGAFVNALGHSFTNYVSNGDATYTADGTKTAVCDREGCNVTDTIADAGTKLTSSFAFETLTVDNLAVSGEFANAVTTFDFASEINNVGLYTFKVFSDEAKTTELTNVNVTLNEGNNVFYVVSYLNNVEEDTYVVTIYRNVTYQVTFNSDGGSTVDAIFVEEGTFASAPTAPTKVGYNFAGWVDANDDAFIFETSAINSAITLKATWSAKTDIAYKVEYYLENVANDEYTLKADATVNEVGTTDAEVFAEIKSFTGFTAEATQVKGNVLADGSLVLKVYYQRNEFTVTFNANGGTLVSGDETQSVKYEGNAVAPVYTKVGYNLSWNKDLNNITEAQEISAVWNPADGIVYKVKHLLEGLDGNFELEETDELTGTTEAEVTAVTKNYTHFTAPTTAVKGNVLPDGSLVLEVKYTRNSYTVTFDGDGATTSEGTLVQTVKYGASAVAPTFAKVIGEVEYTFDEFDKAFDNIEGDITVKAKWVDNNKYVSYVYAGVEITKKVAKVGGEYNVFATNDDILAKVNELETANFGYHVEWFIGENKFASLEFNTENIADVTIEAKLIKNSATLVITVWGPADDITVGAINGKYTETVTVAHGDDIFELVEIEAFKGYELVCFADTGWFEGVYEEPTASAVVKNGVIDVANDGATITIYAFFYNYTIS